MRFREILLRFTHWVHNRLTDYGDSDSSQLTDEGLMIENGGQGGSGEGADTNAVKAVAVRGKNGSFPDRQAGLEKIQVGFDHLINELSSINDHLRKQVAQHEDLIARVDQLPKLAESFPASVENQKLLTDQLISQLKTNLLKDQQLLNAVEKIPGEEAKQTDCLSSIERQLSAAADVDVQMTETFNKFNESLSKLNHSTREHSDGISQMSRTFAASDRYLKFIVTRQTRQFIWVFYSALAVCAVIILILVGIVIYLAR